MKNLCLFSFLLCACFCARGQAYYQPDTSVKVFAYGAEQMLAWCGGFNNPQFTMGDLNHDGLQDLVVYEYFNSVRTFINVGTAGAPVYRYAPEYALNFPPVNDYLVLADYNRDGVPDLFHQGGTGFAVYKGYYNAYNQLCFNFYENLYYNNDRDVTIPVNAYNNPSDIPAIVDVDGDGDLDFISYFITGAANAGAMYYYKNMQVERGLPPDSIVIELADECWGKVYQATPRTHVLQYWCDESNLRFPRMSKRVTCQGNTPCLFDYDMDGDYDYLDGNTLYKEMTFLQNGRIPYNPSGNDSMVYQDTMWQSLPGGRQIEISSWPAAFNVDIDQDGKKDLLIAPNASPAENYHCIWYYKNYTTPGHPDWRFQSDSFLVDQSIDLGTASYPMLFDFDKDGKPDLLVGSDGYFQSGTGLLQSRMSYYRNTSTPGNPSFTLMGTDLLALDSFGFKGIAPATGDLDLDGKTDLVLGHSDGTLSWFRNVAASESVAPDWRLRELVMTDENGAIINTGGYATPLVYDVDKDGRNDLVMGNSYGTLIYYRNETLDSGTLRLRLVTNSLGHVKVDSADIFGIYSVPFIGRIDSTGTEYLLVGSNSGDIYRYTGFQGGDTSAVYTMLDQNYGFIDSNYNAYNHGNNGLYQYSGLRSTVTVGDLAGDGKLYLIAGNNKGGLQLYSQQKYQKPKVVNRTGLQNLEDPVQVLLYPNPAGDVAHVSWNGLPDGKLMLRVLDVQGRVLYTATHPASENVATVPLSDLSSGLYICEIQSGNSRTYTRFAVVK